MMKRLSAAAAVALTALLVGTEARAQDSLPKKTPSGVTTPSTTMPSSTMTLGGKGTPATAAAAGDSELTWYRGYGWGYRRGYYAGYYGGLGGFYGGYPVVASYYPATTYYTPYYSAPVYSAPVYTAPVYSAPLYVPPAVGFYGRFGGIGLGIRINGQVSDVVAPALTLTQPGSTAPTAVMPANVTPATPSNAIPTPMPSAPAVQPAPNSNRYDGGPANPIPLPKLDSGSPSGQGASAVVPDAGLPVSLKKAQPKLPPKPLAYKAYGDK